MTRANRLLPTLLLALSLPAAAAERPVFADDFSSEASGWTNTQVADHKARGIALYNGSGGYQMTPVADDTFGIMPAPKQAATGDVRVEAALFLYTGVGNGTAGVVCRHQDNDNFYAFLVTGGHRAAILKIHAGQSTPLATTQFKGTMPNMADVRIGARCDGAALKLTLDGKVVAEASDAALTGGRTGLIVMGEKTAGTNAVFDDFKLFQIAR